MLPIIIATATEVAAQAIIQQSKNKPGGAPLATPARPTWKDRAADIAFWTITLLPGVLIATCAGMACYIIIKIACAKQGVSFP